MGRGISQRVLRRPSCTKELSLDECLAANSEVRCGYLSGVSQTLVLPLGIGYVLLELLVKFVEVGDGVSGASRSEVALGVNSDVRVVALVSIEGCNTGSRTLRVIVCELG